MVTRPSLAVRFVRMIISVVNQTNGEISDADLLAAIRAVNRQIAEDFVPYWGMPATLRLEGTLLPCRGSSCGRRVWEARSRVTAKQPDGVRTLLLQRRSR